MFQCEKCDYKTKKRGTMAKPINTKHCHTDITKKLKAETDNKIDHKNCGDCAGLLDCENKNCDYEANQDSCKYCRNLLTEAFCKKMLHNGLTSSGQLHR